MAATGYWRYSPHVRRWVATLVFSAAVLTACGSTTSGATATSAAGTAPSAPFALQFSADVVGGGQLDFRSLAGKTLALWFWAPT
jgi:hypothetical protein